jgi:transcription antitermination factor NusG
LISISDLQSRVASQLPWFALQVRCRREALVLAHLQARGYECFLPLYKSVRRWSDRLKEVEQPLFPGYLFSRFDFHSRGPLLMTPGVQQIVGVGGSPTPVAESELESIQRALASGLSSQPWPYLQVGDQVRVIYGSLTDLEGILIHFKGCHRIVLSLTLLRRSVAVEIDRAWVAPVREARTALASRILDSRAAMEPALGS